MKSYNWSKSDLPPSSPSSPSVFSAFCGGGGSSFGFQLAGFKISGGCDIDSKALDVFKDNFTNAQYFNCPLRIIDETQINPVDILDASPSLPLDNKIKEKYLSDPIDLVFDTINLTRKINPKVLFMDVSSNLSSQMFKPYTLYIFSVLRKMGYDPKLFTVDSLDFNTCQKRESCILIASRVISKKEISINVVKDTSQRITCQEALQHLPEIINEDDPLFMTDPIIEKYHSLVKLGGSYGHAFQELRNVRSYANWFKIDNLSPCFALNHHPLLTHHKQKRFLTLNEYIAISGFPKDYICGGQQLGKYLIGSASPPFMVKEFAESIMRHING